MAGYSVTEKVYGQETSKGLYEVHRRVLADRDSDEVKVQTFMTFPNTKHEVWGLTELKAMKDALDEFFDEEGEE